MKHGKYAYERGCRCDICRAANTAKQSGRRARRKAEREVSYTTVSRPALVQIPKPVVMPSPEPKSVTAQDLARQDMRDILSALDNDPDWRGVVEEEISGEIAALRKLIDSHNSTGRQPRLQYGYSDGVFWAGAADDYPEEISVPSDSPGLSLVIPLRTETRAVPRAVQLPQRAPLARPRNVRGVAPSVPALPGRAANSARQRAASPGPGDAPTWG